MNLVNVSTLLLKDFAEKGQTRPNLCNFKAIFVFIVNFIHIVTISVLITFRSIMVHYE